MDEMSRARQEIDRIDAQLADLYAARMRAVDRIAAYKRANCLPVGDPAREREVIAQGCARVEDPALRPGFAALLSHLIRLSRQYQQAQKAPADALQVCLPEASCPVTVRPGALQHAGDFLDLRRTVCIVTDDGVPPEYARTLAAQCAEAEIVTLPQGEAHKTLQTLTELLSRLQRRGLRRGDCVAAVGGGVVGDLAGFAASCWLRGIDFYNCPTTLLAMADASVGGKTAVDFGGVKNSVGAFWQPRAVLIDPALLGTLPPRQLANGMAEIVKMALTCDRDLFERLEREEAPNLPELITRALRIKIALVERDERDAGARRILNFGHTLGHGVEAAAGGALLHGECVALGMLPMCAQPVRARLARVLTRLGLPTSLRGDADQILAAAARDKKAETDGIETIFVDEVGACRLEKLGLPALRARLETLLRQQGEETR